MEINFYKAVTLKERLASLRPLRRETLVAEANVDLAERRMLRWRSQSPFTTGAYFAQRLANDGITEEELRYLLGEPIEAIHERFPTPPSWLAELAQAFSPPFSSLSNPSHQNTCGRDEWGRWGVIEPLVSRARDRVHQGVQTLTQARSNLPFDPDTIEDIVFTDLEGKLTTRLSRTMVLELHVARLHGLLEGATPRERFQCFLQRVRRRDNALAILQEYPVLARQLVICIDNWVTFSLEFLQHLCTDWEEIRAVFCPRDDPGGLVSVAGGMGDSHRNGRSVQVANFSSGLQVVYKPRPMTIDVHFQRLLTWINERGDHPPFRTLKVLDRGTYGWVECAVAQGCTSANEVWRFYERLGGYLALLYALEATDFHSENLIAAGEHPVLPDLEALFHPRVNGIDMRNDVSPAFDAFTHSVMRVKLLPHRQWANAESEGIDLSGVGAVAGQLTPFRAPAWEGEGTDGMRFTRKRLAMPEYRNRPTLNGAEVNVPDYGEAMVTGFTRIYRLLLEHRDVLLSHDGPLDRFAGDEARVILRPTQTYASLLYESFHPDVLRDSLDRDRLFDRLWVAVEQLPHLVRVIPAEREDLQKGDIPVFTTRPDSRDIWSSSGERIVDFFGQSGMEHVRHRLQHLCDHDLARQVWFIRASITSLSPGLHRRGSSPSRSAEPQPLIDRERLMAAARAVGDRLEHLALRGMHGVSWIGLTLRNGRHWTLGELGTDLYDGLPGVTLFLAYLGAVARDERYTSLARASLATMRSQLECGRPFIRSIGAFNGWGGVIYALAHLGVMWDQPALLSEAEALVEFLPSLIEQDGLLDVVAGAAGCIGSLIALYRCAPSGHTLTAAIQAGDRLITRSQPRDHGIGWVIPVAGTRPLAGFSHGAAGIAWSLLELAALSGEGRFRTAALDAIAYERSLFSPEVGNWLDVRETTGKGTNDGQEKFMTAWCHGAPGIGLARLRSLRQLDDEKTRAEIDTALETTLAHGFGGNHSLCHGDLGNLELLLQAKEMFENPRWGAELNRTTAMTMQSIDRVGRLCGLPSQVESPGLMTGLAGIGYGLLRLAEPTRVPSVLVLAPPA